MIYIGCVCDLLTSEERSEPTAPSTYRGACVSVQRESSHACKLINPIQNVLLIGDKGDVI